MATGGFDGPVGIAAAARAALEASAGGRPVVVVGRADGDGDGRRMLVYGPGESRGTLGDPMLDRAAHDLGAAMANDPESSPRTVPVEGVAGASLYAEPYRHPARLFIVGAGHIAVPLARVGALLAMPVVVLDDREAFATEERFPAASRVVRLDFSDPFAAIEPGRDDFVVLVTRAHRYDFDCLRHLVDRPHRPRYIGMVGSRRRVRAAFRALLDAGIAADRLASIHAPIGLDIGAETPEEIAVAIAAEIVAVRRGVAADGSLRDRERVVERWTAPPSGDDV